MIGFIQAVVTGTTVGLIYGLMALGFVLIFKSSKIFNFAQGEMVMFGSFLVWTFMTQFHLPVLLGLLIALIIFGLVGYSLERFPFRAMIGQPILSIIMVTLALAVFFRGLAILLWANYIGIKFPTIIPDGMIHVFSITFSSVTIWICLLVFSLVIILSLFFRFTRIGLHMRAAAESHQVSQSMGIRVTAAIAQSAAMAAVLASVGGFLLGYIRGIDFGLANIGLIAIAAALLGGLESFKGAIIGGVIIGLTEIFTGTYIGHGLKEVVPFIVMVLVVLFRPYGLFGLEEIERV